MSSESELRDAIRSSANIPTTGINTDAVVRRARARRIPRQIAFSSLSVLAIAGIATVGFTVIPALQSGHNSADQSSMLSMAPESAPEGGAESSSAKQMDDRGALTNLCGTATVATAPNSAGLELRVSFPDTAPADGLDVVGTVEITNTGATAVSGTTAAAPTIVVSQGGTTVWHTHGAMIMMVINVDLEPGESLSYGAHFDAVECGLQDDEDGMFRANLPALTAGSYEVMAEIVFVPHASEDGESVLVGGPAQSVELR